MHCLLIFKEKIFIRYITNREDIWIAFGCSHPLLEISPLNPLPIQQYLFNKYVRGDSALKISALMKMHSYCEKLT